MYEHMTIPWPRPRGALSPSRARPAVVVGCLLALSGYAGVAGATTIHVDTNLQKISALGGCSLQEAIWATNLGNNEAIVANESGAMTTIETECVLEDDGKGGYTIVLPGDTTFQMTHVVDDPFNYMGPTATPIVLSDVIIEANGALIEHASIDTFFRAFAVGTVGFATGERQAPGAGALTIRNAHIRGFAVKGGDGAYGGGGGLGAGGAIYVHGGSLTVESSTFQGNAVYGGNGSRNVLNTGGGGGGGLSGNGARAGEAPQDTGQDQGGGGGGGGGARGDGGTGWSNCGSPCLGIGAEGGGGGGTLGDGQNAGGSSDSRGGFDCGGRGGHLDWTLDQDGDDGSCPGGGGGGGRDSLYAVDFFQIGGNGGDGNYGGGGGGGAGLLTPGHGGHGGFGGGGGGVYPGHSAPPYICSPDGGDGGFGGGGGAGPGGFACPPGIYTGPGRGGSFAGNASDRDGGGGAGLGGAIFNHSGYVRVLNSTFTANDAARGTAGSWPNNEPANSGQDQGAAIFSVGGTLTVLNSTIYGNKGTSSINGGAGIVVYAPGYDIFSPVMQIPPTRFELRNTIIANNAAGSVVTKECRLIDSDDNSVVFVGSGNLIEANDNCDEGHDLSDDPLLESLKLNPPGLTPTMALTADSPAIDAADGANALATDQRGVARPVGLESDIGAFEWGAAVAKCKDVTVSANDSCTAHASIDDGSFAPGGGDILLSQDPPGPYALGETQVTLTASHESGEADSCEATVTVVDDTPPVITVTNAIPVLSPMRKHDLVNVGLGATATDACSTAPTNFQVAVFGDEDDETPTSADLTVFSPDATSLATRTLRLRAERMDSADGRVYLMSLSGTDGAGNTGYGCATVVVPHNSSAASLALVSGQAQDAVSWCSANDGAAPAGFSVIGDGPTIGPKPKK